MPESMFQLKCCYLFAWGIFFGHVSCAVRMYCAWVIICHLKPGAQLTLRAPGRAASSFFAHYLSSSSSLSHSIPPFVFAPPVFESLFYWERWLQGLQVAGILLFIFCCHQIYLKAIQPKNNQAKPSWSSCQTWWRLSFVKTWRLDIFSRRGFWGGFDSDCIPKAAQQNALRCN